MEYVYLLVAGVLVSFMHVYLVWRHLETPRRSISEYVILDKKSHLLYFVTHVICEVFVLLYAYQFFIVQHGFAAPFYLLLVFAVLDFVQATLASRGRTEKIHLVAAYVSWVCYLVAGLVALLGLTFIQPYGYIAWSLLAMVIVMFVYMHINRTKLYPYQLLMVPLYVVCLLIITIGAI